MKIFLLLTLFSCFSYIGFSVGNSYTKKEKFYIELNNFISTMLSEINFLKTDILSIIKKYQTNNLDFKIFLDNLSSQFLFEKPYKNLENLTESENEELKNFVNFLGKNDQIVECEIIKNHLENLKNKLTETKELNKKYGNMYKKLGVITGIFVCIVVI